MKIKKSIWVKTSYVGFHFWEEAPAKVSFLRTRHRHVFHVTVKWEINEDRQLEFFIQKEKVNTALFYITQYQEKYGYSCEKVAQELWEVLLEKPIEITVSEDNENGATLTFDHGI